MKKYSNGEIGINEIQREISIENIGYIGENIARLDLQREKRRGCPEVILALNKQYNDLYEITLMTLQKTGLALITKASQEVFSKLSTQLKKEGYMTETATRGTTILVSTKELTLGENSPQTGIICAGTSDIPIAEEARMMAKAMGCVTDLSYDVGIAGLHRLLPALRSIDGKKRRGSRSSSWNGRGSSICHFSVGGCPGHRSTYINRLRDGVWRHRSFDINATDLHIWIGRYEYR